MSWNAMLMALAVASADPPLGSRGDRLEVTDEDARAIRDMIRSQLSAFRQGDGDGALALSTGELRDAFADGESLIEAVRAGYGPLAAVRQVVFGSLVLTPDGLAQIIEVAGADGEPTRAMYLVESEDGVWKAGGCVLLAEPEEAAIAA